MYYKANQHYVYNSHWHSRKKNIVKLHKIFCISLISTQGLKNKKAGKMCNIVPV